ncbi:ABC transporter permease [Sphaerisporangium sp. NPDC088356]|uniref:ABC transporter permease n=1 Tax=Sphaerisporangium sp. NPDC088356 TaxID=3154871 RepID=UPI0034152BF2
MNRPAPATRGRSKLLSALVGSALLIGVVVMLIGFSVASPLFLTPNNLRQILLEGSVLALVAAPLTILVLMGMIDLSVGSMLGVGGVVAGELMVRFHVNPLLAVLVAVAVGVLIGLANGTLVGFLRWSPIVVTLGMLTALRGVAQVIAPQTPNGFPAGFGSLGAGYVLGIPAPLFFGAGAFVVAAVFLYRTPWGRHAYAIGVNREAAFLSGVAVRRLPMIAFAVTGGAAALGGVLDAARLDAAPGGTLGVGFELTVLTAVLLGGVAFEGGRGTLFGAVLGVLFLVILQNGLTLLNVQNYYQDIANGLALVVAAALNFAAERQGTAGGLTALLDLVRDRQVRPAAPQAENTPIPAEDGLVTK